MSFGLVPGSPSGIGSPSSAKSSVQKAGIGPSQAWPRGEQGASVRRQITFPHQLAAIEPVVVGVVGEVVGQPDERTRPCDGSCDAGRVA